MKEGIIYGTFGTLSITPYDYLFEYILFKYGDGQYVHSANDIDEFISGASGKKENRTPNPKLFFQFIFFSNRFQNKFCAWEKFGK